MTFTFSLTQFLIEALLSHLTLTEPVATSSIPRLSSINPHTETYKVASVLSPITNKTVHATARTHVLATISINQIEDHRYCSFNRKKKILIYNLT